MADFFVEFKNIYISLQKQNQTPQIADEYLFDHQICRKSLFVKTGGTTVLLHLRPEKCTSVHLNSTIFGSMYCQYVYFKLYESTKQKDYYKNIEQGNQLAIQFGGTPKIMKKRAKLAGKWPKQGIILNFIWVKGLLS